MAGEMENARALRAKANYERLKEMPAFDRYIQFGGSPSIEETGFTPEQQQKFIDALQYGQSIKQNFNQELTRDLGAIEGLDVHTTVPEGDGETLIEVMPSKPQR